MNFVCDIGTDSPTRCPSCGRAGHGERFVPGVGGTRRVDATLPDGRISWAVEPGQPAGYVCMGCAYESPTLEPFVQAWRDHDAAEKAAARAPVEARALEYAARLEGRTILAARFEVVPPGCPGTYDIEGLVFTLDDGTTVTLRAHGWHGIQSLSASFQPGEPPPRRANL